MKNTIPVILLKELIILPNQEIKIELNNKISKLIIKKSTLEYDSKVLVVAPLDKKEEEPSVDDLPNVGIIAKIKSKIQLPSGNVRLTLRGLVRVVVTKYFVSNWNEDVLNAEYQKIELPKFAPEEEKALTRKLIATLKEYIDSSNNISNSILTTVTKAKSLDHITDIIASFLNFNYEKKCEYMQNYNPLNRAKNLLNDLKEEIAIIKLEDELDERVSEVIEANQKEFILKEKIKVIKEELGEKSTQEQETEEFINKLNTLKLTSSIQKKLENEIEKFSLINESSPEMGVIRTYIDWLINLPWNNKTKDPINPDEIIEKLNQTHYGLTEIKERISEYIAVKAKNNNIKTPIICLIGPPGVGKTSIAMAIAEVLNRKFYKISVGGLNDSTELIGSRRTYLGANPGKIIQGLKSCGSKNPVMLIDEVDKMTKNYHGDPASTLLEIIDPIQNKMFRDNYIEEPFDLSDILFILTANNINDIPEVLLDRVEVINLNSYTIFDKKDIAKYYLLPKIYKEYNYEITISDELIKTIINNYTKEAGVRELERKLEKVVRKMVIASRKKLTSKDLPILLGNPMEENIPLASGKIGEANILGVNSYGGFCSKVEAKIVEGTGKYYFTGSVGDILKESIYVALSYIKTNYKMTLDKKDVYIHFLDAATKKDGPSGGLAILVALTSIVKKKKVPKNMAFTGEITLNGEILAIGGLKEKLITAYNNDVNIVYIPRANKKELEDLPNIIKEKLDIRCINEFKELYTKVFK